MSPLFRCSLAFASTLVVASAAAGGSASQFRLAPDARNDEDCSSLDPVLARPHALTQRDGDVELRSAGAIEGRMIRVKPGVYQITYELNGRRLDIIAELTSPARTLIVTERGRSCRWSAQAQ